MKPVLFLLLASSSLSFTDSLAAIINCSAGYCSNSQRKILGIAPNPKAPNVITTTPTDPIPNWAPVGETPAKRPDLRLVQLEKLLALIQKEKAVLQAQRAQGKFPAYVKEPIDQSVLGDNPVHPPPKAKNALNIKTIISLLGNLESTSIGKPGPDGKVNLDGINGLVKGLTTGNLPTGTLLAALATPGPTPAKTPSPNKIASKVATPLKGGAPAAKGPDLGALAGLLGGGGAGGLDLGAIAGALGGGGLKGLDLGAIAGALGGAGGKGKVDPNALLSLAQSFLGK